MSTPELDSVYFSPRPWAKRVHDWVKHARANGRAPSFLDANLGVIRQLLGHPETGPRMVINIGADALLSFLSSDNYKNIYENPVVGGKPRSPSKERHTVDELLGLEPDASAYYFGAVALDGAGVRFYGEYCMVIKASRIAADTRVFDRDSYDLLQPPLADRGAAKTRRIVSALKGTWGDDLVGMLIMKILPRLPAVQHLITAGNVSGLVISDQEFVEIHLKDKIHQVHVEEIRQSPDAASIEAAIASRRRSRQPPTIVEVRWVEQRRRVFARLAQKSIPFRIVTLQSRGYQWA
jgi:hypothetical protein